MLIFKSFFELGQWWFRDHKTKTYYQAATNTVVREVVGCGMTKEEIQREMRTNRCVGYNYNDELV